MEPEETYDNACRMNRNEHAPTWLGIGRDIRCFAVDYRIPLDFLGTILPKRHGAAHEYPEFGNTRLEAGPIAFVIGRGSARRYDITRGIEDGALPILHSIRREESVVCRVTTFVTLEKQTLSASAVRGARRPAVLKRAFVACACLCAA